VVEKYGHRIIKQRMRKLYDGGTLTYGEFKARIREATCRHVDETIELHAEVGNITIDDLVVEEKVVSSTTTSKMDEKRDIGLSSDDDGDNDDHTAAADNNDDNDDVEAPTIPGLLKPTSRKRSRRTPPKLLPPDLQDAAWRLNVRTRGSVKAPALVHKH
jgi:hypothetical protein